MEGSNYEYRIKQTSGHPQRQIHKASVWKNESKNGPFYGTTIERTYKDGDEYKTSHTLHGRDQLAAAQLLIEAYGETRKLEQADYEANKPAPAN